MQLVSTAETNLDTFISIIIGCISIGIILSAPMGPIGILCVQRTLNKGRLSGLFTGIGAAFSDLFYCLLAGLGLSIVTDFIEANVNILQVAGSVILVIYSLYMILHDPIKKNVDDKESQAGNDNTRDMITGFFLTLSNPLIIFLVLPLFARFSFPMADYKFYHIITGYVFIVVGALLWWSVITYAVDKVRSRFNINSMRTINRVMGTILLAVALYGLATGTIAYLHQFHVI